MSSINGSPPFFPPSIMGRVVRKIERYNMPDGIAREKRWVQVTFQAPDGTSHTDESIEVVPPLDDGIVPDDMTDVLYCRLCGRVVCRSVHAFSCQACGSTYCVGCRVTVQGATGQVTLCATCARDAMTPAFVRRFCNLVWGE